MSRSWRAYAAAFAATFFTVAASAATLTLGDASLSGDQLTVPVTVSGADAGDLKLYIGEAGPKDGEPTATASAATLAITGDSSYNLTAQISVGAKIAYKAVLGTDESASGSITATDTSEYIWVNNATGLWSNPDNWTRKNTATDSYKNIGYPAYSTGVIRFNGGQTAEVTLDANYGRFGDLKIDNPNLNLTIRGNGYELKVNNTACTSDNTFVFDNVRFISDGSYTLGSRSTMQMVNGSYFQTKWEFNVNGTNAKLYVGPECEINASSGYWWTFRLDGNGATVEIDDGYIHSRGFRFASQQTDATPAGIIFKGTHPRFEFQQEFVGCSYALPNAVVFEYYVPVGGYAQAPFCKTESGNWIALDNKWQDHEQSSSVYDSKVKFKVSKLSPFYQSEGTLDVCLFDWSKTDQGVKTSQVLLEETDTPTTDYLEKRASQQGVDMDQVWAHLTGKGIPADLPTIDATATVSVNDETAVLTVGGEIKSISSTLLNKVQLWVGMVGGDGDAEGAMQLVDTLTVTETGAFTMQYAAKFGAKVASKLVIVGVDAESGKVWANGSTAVITKTLMDNAEYYWKDNTTGIWSDPDNWTYTDDGTPRLGYPSNGGKFHFRGNSSYTVYVDGYYSGFDWNNEIGWGGADITFIGTVDNAYVSGLSINCYENVKTTLDNVTCRFGNYWAYANSGLTLTNNAAMNSVWAGGIDGENAYVYVGSNCTFATGVGENWHIGKIQGKNATFTVDNGTFSAAAMTIGSGESSDAPTTLRFMGKNAKMDCKVYLKNVNTVEGASRVEFVIPEGGYAATPITKGGSDETAFLAPDGEGKMPICMSVLKSSPYLKVRGKFTQQLVDWSTSTAETKLNTAGVALAEMPGSEKSSIYFTPEMGEAKSGIAAFCYGKDGFAVVVR